MSWDGKMYEKYRIVHTDGTPLKGKKYFVLRLDSDDPVEAARVAAAMRAYKSEPRNCDVGTMEEMADRLDLFCSKYKCSGAWDSTSPECPIPEDLRGVNCAIAWSQMPYEEGGAK